MNKKRYDNHNQIYKKLREYREAAGLSQRAMAEKMQEIGIPVYQQLLGKIERNERYVLEEELLGFCRILQVQPAQLMNEEAAD